jgi:hypothetical protein
MGNLVSSSSEQRRQEAFTESNLAVGRRTLNLFIGQVAKRETPPRIMKVLLHKWIPDLVQVDKEFSLQEQIAN